MYTYFLFLTGILWGILFAPSAWAEAPQVDFSTLSSSAVVEQSDRSGTPHPVVARLITDKSAVQEGGVLRFGGSPHHGRQVAYVLAISRWCGKEDIDRLAASTVLNKFHVCLSSSTSVF